MTDEEFRARLREKHPDSADQMEAMASEMGCTVLELSEMMIGSAFAMITGQPVETTNE